MDENNIKIAICDDEEIFCIEIYELCEKYMRESGKECYIKTFQSGESFLKDEMGFDIVFLDVSMPNKDGFSVARELNTRSQRINIIFLTSKISMMQQAFEVKAFRYLYKACEDQEIYKALEEAINELLDVKVLLIEQRGEKQVLKCKDIYCFEVLGDETCIYYQQKRIIVNKSLKSWMKILNDDFCQCHKSFVVNLWNIEQCNKDTILLKNGMEINISVRKRKEIHIVFKNFIKKNARYL